MNTKRTASVDYRARYRSPAEVLADRSLEGDDKLHILREWRLDTIRRIQSAAEGMEGQAPTDLREVERALEILENAPGARA
jgi:hypothetical protein